MISLSELLNELNTQFLNKYNTVLIGGFNEPFYKTFTKGKKAEIQFSHDYIRSALHELSHWCVAGTERRNLDDYGYWYAQDGRNQQQQDEFFKVEVKPQSIEWAFSILCGVKFEASVDNLDNSVKGVDEFKNNLDTQIKKYIDYGFNPRVNGVFTVIANFQNIESPLLLIKNEVAHNKF